MSIKQSKQYNRYLGAAIIAIIIVLVAGCAPMPIDDAPGETVFLNSNPDLEYGGCDVVIFHNQQGNREFIRQCYPEGYEVYNVVENYPIRVEHRGNIYSIRPLNTYGSIGFRLPLMTLTPGQYIIKAIGDGHLWGVPEDFSLQAHCSIEGVEGIIHLNIVELRGNGGYEAMFVLNAPTLGVYDCAVYLRIIHPSMTADSYLTFERITVEAAP